MIMIQMMLMMMVALAMTTIKGRWHQEYFLREVPQYLEAIEDFDACLGRGFRFCGATLGARDKTRNVGIPSCFGISSALPGPPRPPRFPRKPSELLLASTSLKEICVEPTGFGSIPGPPFRSSTTEVTVGVLLNSTVLHVIMFKIAKELLHFR